MSEVLRSFDASIRDESGEYHARVVGSPTNDGMWQGWFEFVPIDDRHTDALISPVESRQPNRQDLAYWATGLTAVYAEGALRRARNPIVVQTRVLEIPVSDAPAPRSVMMPARAVIPAAVLDPFEIGSRSLDILTQSLRALGRARLVAIISAYDLHPGGRDLQPFSEAQLIALIVGAVEAALTSRTR